ncbi:GTP cyclohydrolase I, partial [Enorma sp.]
MAIDRERAERAIREFLIAVGEDPDRPGLVETPDRVARAAEEILGGYDDEPEHHLRKQFHETESEDMVIVRDIPFSSLCEHHI